MKAAKRHIEKVPIKLGGMACLLIVILFAFSFSLNGQNHLEPTIHSTGLYNWQAEYYAKVGEVLFPDTEYFEKSRYLILPSFGLETGMRILYDQSTKTHSLEVLVVKKSIWESLTQDKKRFRAGVDRTSIPIKEGDAEDIIKMYEASLSSIKLPENPRIGIDGVTYFLSNYSYTGTIWSPKNGLTKELIEISKEIRKKSLENNKWLGLDDVLLARIVDLGEQFKIKN